jgi:hypothetical protein
MLMSKFYTRAAKPPANNDPRVLTPTSIPIFILPPTLDHVTNNNNNNNNNNSGMLKNEQKGNFLNIRLI